MEFTPEFITEQNLTEEQVTAIKGFSNDYIAEIKGGASRNADKILDNVASGILTKHQLDIPRDKGEKYEDWMGRITDAKFETTKSSLETKIAEYDEKIKNTKGDETLKAEFEQTKAQLVEFQKKAAQVDELAPYKEKYEQLSEKTSQLTIETAFNSVKPAFPETVNPYEAKAKWDEFTSGILNEWTPEKVDGEWMLINKENSFKTMKLAIGKGAAATRHWGERNKNRKHRWCSFRSTRKCG
jgi:hypothetical protein